MHTVGAQFMVGEFCTIGQDNKPSGKWVCSQKELGTGSKNSTNLSHPVLSDHSMCTWEEPTNLPTCPTTEGQAC